MNESDTHFENLLRSLPPAAPSALLSARVAHELELDAQWLPAPRKRLAQRWLAPAGWGALGAAAAVAVMTVLPDPQPASPSGPAVATTASPATVRELLPVPVTTVREMVSTQDDGIQYNATSHLPEQRLKYVTVERHAWIDPRDGAEITVEVPREDSVILPASFQ